MVKKFISYDPTTGKIKGNHISSTNKGWDDVEGNYPYILKCGIDFPEELWEKAETRHVVDVNTKKLKEK